MAVPSALVIGSWPLDDATRVTMTVLMWTPSTLHDAIVAVSTPGMLERWAEALAREP